MSSHHLVVSDAPLARLRPDSVYFAEEGVKSTS